jgi:hypothetical protein
MWGIASTASTKATKAANDASFAYAMSRKIWILGLFW